MKQYKFGFSAKGLVAFLLMMLPNIVWTIRPPGNDILSAGGGTYPVAELLQAMLQWLMIGALVFIVRQEQPRTDKAKVFVSCGAVCLLAYYGLWVLYYGGIHGDWLLMGLAVFPALYFVFVALWLQNKIALVPAIAFGVIHCVLSWMLYVR